VKAWHLFVGAAALSTTLAAVAVSTRCLDFYRDVARHVERSPQYEKDFGAGVFVRKVSNDEIRIEPPPEVVNSIRQAHTAVEKRSQGAGASFTVLFGGFSEGEVIGFRAMLARDARLKADEKLTAILLGGNALSERSYDGVRDLALAARDRMNLRYQWARADVVAQPSAPTEREERYLLTAHRDNRPDDFLLKIRLRAASMLKNRAAQISSMLARPGLTNATPEQVAHEMISSLKQSDPGVTAVTLKVIAGDFVIADNR